MSFTSWDALPSLQLVDGVELTPIWLEGVMAVRVRLAPGVLVPAHAHPHRQLGTVLEGSVRFRIGDDERELAPGAVYAVPGDIEHEARAGEGGCVLIEAFGPERTDLIEKLPR